MEQDSMMLFTPASVLDLLSQIPELEGQPLELVETGDGQLQLTIGQGSYNLTPEQPAEVEVAEEDLQYVVDTNETAYDTLEFEQETVEGDPIQSGILKHLAKAILIGGMVKLTSNLLK